MLIEYKVATRCQLALEKNGSHDDRASDQINPSHHDEEIGCRRSTVGSFASSFFVVVGSNDVGEAPSTALHESETKWKNNAA